MTTAKLTKTESRVLRALRLIEQTEVERINEAARVFGLDPYNGEGVLAGFLTAVETVTIGRRSSELQISDALNRLAGRELIEQTTVNGMGGSLALYRLNH